MATVFVEFVRQVDYTNGLEGAFFDADTTATAELFRNYDFVFFEADGFNTTTYHGTVFYAHLVAFLWLALITIHYGDAGHEYSRI
jgi:hypothetical protein